MNYKFLFIVLTILNHSSIYSMEKESTILPSSTMLSGPPNEIAKFFKINQFFYEDLCHNGTLYAQYRSEKTRDIAYLTSENYKPKNLKENFPALPKDGSTTKYAEIEFDKESGEIKILACQLLILNKATSEFKITDIKIPLVKNDNYFKIKA